MRLESNQGEGGGGERRDEAIGGGGRGRGKKRGRRKIAREGYNIVGMNAIMNNFVVFLLFCLFSLEH